MIARLRSRRVCRMRLRAIQPVRQSRSKPEGNAMRAPDSGCTHVPGRFAVPASGAGRSMETSDRTKSGKLKTSARFFSLLFSFLAFGVCEVRAQDLYVIIHHDAALRSCPDSKCRVVAQLPILSRVHVRGEVKPSKTDYREGLWTYVYATRRSRDSGWILDDHIGYPGRFRRVRSWRSGQFSYCIGDYCPELTFTASGEFTERYPPCFDGLCPDPPSKAPCRFETEKKEIVDGLVYCVSTGNLYRAGKAIRLGGSNSHDFLYLNRRNELCADMYTCQARREKNP